MKAPGVVILVTLFGGAGFAAGFLVSRKKYYALADKTAKDIYDNMPEHDRNLLIAAGLNPDEVVVDYRKIHKTTEKTSATITPEVMNSEHKDRLEEEVKSTPLVNKTNYAGIAKSYNTPTPKEVVTNPKNKASKATITMISEDEANLADEYPTQLIYYKDGIVADIDDNAIVNYKNMIGDIEPIIEELEENGVAYVRNENTKQIYMVEHSENNWKDIASNLQKSALLNLNSESDDD